MNAKADDTKAGGKAGNKAGDKGAGKGAADAGTNAAGAAGSATEGQATAGVSGGPAMGAAGTGGDTGSGGQQSQTSDASADDNAQGAVATQAEKRISPKVVMETNISDLIMSGKLQLPCPLYMLIGRAADLREGETEYGPWTAAVGTFEAERISDGKIFMGKEAHIPGAAGDLLVAELRRFIIEEEQQTDEEKKKRGKRYKMTGETVDVAVMVGIKKSGRAGGQPYEFTVTSLTPVRRSDALAALRQQAMRTLQSLPAAQRPALPSLIRADNPALPSPKPE
jgi:hypothetical protein